MVALAPSPPPTLVFAEMFLTLFFFFYLSFCLYIWHFLPFIKYIFAVVPPVELKGLAMSCDGTVVEVAGTGWDQLCLPHRGPAVKQEHDMGYLHPCCVLVSMVCCTCRGSVLWGTTGKAIRVLPNTQLARARLPSGSHLLLAHCCPEEPGKALPLAHQHGPASLACSHNLLRALYWNNKGAAWLKCKVGYVQGVQAHLRSSDNSLPRVLPGLLQ